IVADCRSGPDPGGGTCRRTARGRAASAPRSPQDGAARWSAVAPDRSQPSPGGDRSVVSYFLTIWSSGLEKPFYSGRMLERIPPYNNPRGASGDFPSRCAIISRLSVCFIALGG